MASKSYAWSQRLDAEVADGAATDVMTPGFQTPENYEITQTGVVVDGQVMAPEEAVVTWAGDFSAVNVSNATGASWQPGQTVYVTVPMKAFDPSSVEDSFTALENRVAANEAAISDLTARVAALEAAGGLTAPAKAPPQPPPSKAAKKDEGDEEEESHHSKAKKDEDHGHSSKKDPPGTPHWKDEDNHKKKK